MTDTPRALYARLGNTHRLPVDVDVVSFTITGAYPAAPLRLVVHGHDGDVLRDVEIPWFALAAPSRPADHLCHDCAAPITGWRDYAPDMAHRSLERLWLPCGHAHTPALPPQDTP